MRFLNWVLSFFKPVEEKYITFRRVKFVEGTNWICPTCRGVIGVAKQDICYGDPGVSSVWDIKNSGAFFSFQCCAQPAHRSEEGRMQFFTPTGWVG